jgi:hypothetical protein
MPHCPNCGSFFPFHKIIEGKHRNLSHRKYCLTCSPFGAHNTRPLGTVMSGTRKSCRICNRDYVVNRSQGHRGTTCNSCLQRIKQIRRKQAAVQYKGGACVECGYNRSIAALTFHHLDASTKDFEIGRKYNLSWKRLKIELDKCELLCANCHAEKHFRSVERYTTQDGTVLS